MTRYIAERDKDPEREGPGSRPLFSGDREGMSYRAADRVLSPEGHPQKNDLLHLSVSFEEVDFEKLGTDEKERRFPSNRSADICFKRRFSSSNSRRRLICEACMPPYFDFHR